MFLHAGWDHILEDDARLQERRDRLEAWIDHTANEVESTATAENEGGIRSRWSDAKASLERQFEVMRTNFNKWRAQRIEKNAEQAAQDAERDAVAAITLASRCVDAAEWAALRADLIGTDVHKGNQPAGPGKRDDATRHPCCEAHNVLTCAGRAGWPTMRQICVLYTFHQLA